MHTDPRIWAALLLVGGLPACRTAEYVGPSLGSQVAEPSRKPHTDPVFAYLLTRYDRDGDGRILSSEYTRGGGDFERLDRSGDGVLTEVDFAASGRRPLGLEVRAARRQRARLLLAAYFQTEEDGDPLVIHEEEWSQAFEIFDLNGNDRLGRSEFERGGALQRAWGLRAGGRWEGLLEVETLDPWERLLQGIDSSDDGFLSRGEVQAFYREQAVASGWTFEASEHVAPVPSLVGQLAPDFELPTVTDSGSVRLSDFAGDRPVALIFGSYT